MTIEYIKASVELAVKFDALQGIFDRIQNGEKVSIQEAKAVARVIPLNPEVVALRKAQKQESYARDILGLEMNMPYGGSNTRARRLREYRRLQVIAR